ncbi:TVP38/TMEM64 family protein [Paenibacillus albus]|uniref:TVP38/TMEM64 family membrane protein n=1 Tax=Paenibacillus albus TaxID=2495582 RepID=A0A3Q8X9H6_9BACL|nr:VTT domain-containing protein [Paenibacillus albus]AZN42681.1 TVP38/TMEM64 family protein [Paenibacillus albus]
MKNKSRLISLVGLILVVIAIVVYIYLLKIGVIQHTLKNVQQLGVWGVLIGIIAQIIVNIFPVPGEFTTYLLMELYGPVLGGAYSWIGGVLGAIGGYYLSRWLINPLKGSKQNNNFKKIKRYVGEQKAFGLLMARFVPFLPYHLINYASGILKVDIKSFIWTTMIGLIPYHIAVSGMYAGMKKGSILWGIVGIGLVILLLGLGGMLKKRRPIDVQDS